MNAELVDQNLIDELLGAGEVGGQKQERRINRRHSFAATQLVAPCNEQVLRSLPTFHPVQFRDLSTSGAGFLWPGEPDFDKVLLLLSNSTMAITTLADVVRYEQDKAAGVAGRYVVGCRMEKVVAKGSIP